MVSVIVPIYNVEKYLKNCIECLIQQSYEELEILLIDDGSTDTSGQIADQYAMKDPRIHVIHQKNGGLSAARNKGLDVAKGEYICFVDSDDTVHHDFIKTLFGLCEEKHCEIAQCGFLRTSEIRNEDKMIDCMDACIYTNIEMLDKIYSALSVETIVAWNKLYHREVFNGVKFPEGMLHEDEATTFRLIYNASHVVRISQPLYYYYQNDLGIMRKNYSLKRLDILKALEMRMQFFKEKELTELYYKDTYKYLCKILIQYYEVAHMQETHKEVLQSLIQKYHAQLKDSKDSRWSLKRRMALYVFGLFPQLYVPLMCGKR